MTRALILVALLWPAAARAQTPEDPLTLEEIAPLPALDAPALGGGPPLTLDEVLGIAQEAYPPMREAARKVEAAQGERLSAEGAFDLKLSAKGLTAPIGYYQTQRLDVELEQPTPVLGATLLGGYRLGVGNFPIYYGGYETLYGGELRLGLRLPLLQGRATDANRAGLRLGELEVEAERRDLDAKRLRAQAEVAEAYWKWVAAGRKLRLTWSLIELAQAREGQLATQVRLGARPVIDLLENRRALLARRQQLVTATRDLEAAAIKLSLYWRDAQGRPLQPDPARLPDIIPAPPALDDAALAAALDEALQRRPEVARERARLAQREELVELADNDLSPQLDLELFTSKDLTERPDRVKKNLGPWIVEGGLVFKLPLQQRKARGKQQSALAKRGAQELQLQWTQELVMAEAQDALSAWRAAWQDLEATRDNAAISERVASAERRRLDLGATDLIKLNLVEQYAFEANVKHIDAQGKLQAAYARLRAATARDD